MQRSDHNNIPMASFGKKISMMKQQNKIVNIISVLK